MLIVPGYNKLTMVLAHFELQNQVYSVQDALANSVTVESALPYAQQLQSNVKKLGIEDDLSIFYWQKGNLNYRYSTFTSRIDEAVLALGRASKPGVSLETQAETVRAAQSSFHDTNGNLIPTFFDDAYRWGGVYNLGLFLYDQIMTLVLGGALLILLTLWYECDSYGRFL